MNLFFYHSPDGDNTANGGAVADAGTQTDNTKLTTTDTVYVSPDSGTTDEAFPVPGSEYDFCVDVANLSSLPSGAFFVRFILDNGTGGSGNQTFDFQQDAGLDADQSVKAVVHFGQFTEDDVEYTLSACIFSPSAPETPINCAGTFGFNPHLSPHNSDSSDPTESTTLDNENDSAFSTSETFSDTNTSSEDSSSSDNSSDLSSDITDITNEPTDASDSSSDSSSDESADDSSSSEDTSSASDSNDNSSDISSQQTSDSNSGTQTAADNVDSEGFRMLDAGTWNSSASLKCMGGQVMHFQIKNVNVLGTTITIASNLGGSKSLIIGPLATVDIRFDCFGREPMGWGFNISTNSDAFVAAWTLFSSWLPGDPPNG